MGDAEDLDMESSSSSGDSEENDVDRWFDPNSFSCSMGGGYRPDLTTKSAEFMEENTHLLGMFMEAEEPEKVVSLKRDYLNLMDLAFYLDNLEMIRKCCKNAFAKFGYEDFMLLVWLYRELKEWETTKDDTILESIYDIFKEALSQKYSSIIVYKFIHFAPYSAHKEDIWKQILDVYLYDFTATAKYVSFWKDFYLEDPPDNEEKCQKVIDVYTKALSIPHLDSETTLSDFQELCNESPEQYRVDWEAVTEAHAVASAKFRSVAEHESDVLGAEDVRPRMFRKYLEAPETARFDRKWVQFIYERMVGACSAIPGCWIAYVRFRQDITEDITDSSGRFFNQSPLEIINRALIFAKTSEELFSIKMELVESENFTVSLLSVMDEALRAPFSTPEPHTNLWIEYLTILRRHSSTDSEDGKNLLRRNFENAWESLSQQWGTLADQNGEILKLWATLEYTDLEDPAKGKSLWQDLMTFGENSARSATWLEFILLEKQKNPSAARKIFKKAIKMPELTDPEVLANAWVRFERLNGSRENLQYCETLCEEILEGRQKLQREEENRRKKNTFKKEERKPPKDLKRKPKENAVKEPQVKRQKVEEKATPSSSTRDPTKDNVTIFVSNLDYSVTEEEIKEAFPELSVVLIDMVRSSSGKNRGFCYIELESEEKVQEALKFDRRPINGRPAYIAGCLRERSQREKVFKYSEELEPTKLFIKGCGSATREELEEIFKPYGELKDVRVVYHKNGNPKGIAYVEFKEEAAASTALLKVDQYQMGKNTLTVCISAPPLRGAPKSLPKVESLGAAKRLIHPGEMRPRMAFIPRSVQQKSAKNGQ